VQALQRMGAYLGTLTTFSIHASTTIDEIIENGQKVQLGGEVIYHVRRPNGFAIEVASDRKIRQFYYDGKTLTVYAPRLGLYATAPAPDTVGKTLDDIYVKYDIPVPLADLFTWSDANLGRAGYLKSAIHVGYASVKGVDTDQYAMREKDLDWQIWIARGDRPLPVKVAITSTLAPSQPQYTTNLVWAENPKLTDADFRFTKPEGAMPIEIVAAQD
jgi:hypothetical protein